MINFFRKTRKKLADDNRPLKYMRYAIGEIVLVVVGILIAIQINNRNEAKKNELMVHHLFEDVLDELAMNIKRVDSLARFYEKKDSIYYLVMQNKLTYDDYAKNEIPGLSNFTTNKNNVHLSTDAYKNLINNLEKTPLHFKPILKQLNYLNNVNKDKVDQKNQESNETVVNTIKGNNKSFNWVSNRSKEAIDKEIEYKLNSWQYKNQVVRYWAIGVDDLLRQSMLYRKNAVNCYQNLAKMINQPIVDQSFSVDSSEAGFYLGEWMLDQMPGVTQTNYLKEGRFYSITSMDTIPKEWIVLSNTKVYSITDHIFATVWGKDGIFYYRQNMNPDVTTVFRKNK